MASQDIQQLKNLLISDTSAEERVEVNQRHLIDKILARYSAEFTIFRELLQNSNDAGATEAEIHFRTRTTEVVPESKPKSIFSSLFAATAWGGSLAGGRQQDPSLLVEVETIEYKNNGRPFSDADWNRLKKIAEGNPDEQKIGFFGVGFYSLFSICEEPFISSGDECMAFFWKGDQLFTKKGKVPAESVSALTTFLLNLREPIDVPNLGDLGRFIANSLAFTENLGSVSVHIDADLVLSFRKHAAPPRPFAFSSSVYNLKSPNQIFTLQDVSIRPVQLNVVAYTDFDKSRSCRGTEVRYDLFMRTSTAVFGVKLPVQLAKEMERTTKKPPPSTTKVHVLYASYDEFVSSSGVRGQSSMFEELVPSPSQQGRVFIGFPTHQTTGCSIHMGAHLIPTVERESIDFVDRTLNIWNQEILTMCGLLARLIYDDEMDAIHKMHSELGPDGLTAESREWLWNRSSHAMSSFTFRASTPAALVGTIGKSFFFKMANKPLSIMTSQGVQSVALARLPDASMEAFIKQTPVVPQAIVQSCSELFRQLKKDGTIRALSLDDVFVEVSKRVLEMSEVAALLRWWLGFRLQNAVEMYEVDRLLQQTRFIAPDDHGTANAASREIRLSQIQSFVNVKVIPPDMKFPLTALPIEISKSFTKSELEAVTRGWTELSVVEWAKFITADPLFQEDVHFVEKVLAVFSRAFGNLTVLSRTELISLLAQKKCVPTNAGLRLPTESYFKTVTLFEDIPTVNLASPKSVSDTFLKVIGVREHVDLQIVFDRLNDLKWDHIQLVKYLASVQTKLQESELYQLRMTPLFPPEMSDGSSSSERYKASELHAPNDTLRGFGLKLIDWKGKWKASTDEAKFLALLGLRTYIQLPELISLCAASDVPKRQALLVYFLDHYKAHYKDLYRAGSITTPFLPSTDPTKLFTPANCFAEPECAVMGFAILSSDLREHAAKFGVQPNPSSQTLVSRLVSHPPPLDRAREVFAYLSSRQSEFLNDHWRVLRTSKFIPVHESKSSVPYSYFEPSSVYFGSDQSQYRDLFVFVDFGTQSNAFLRACGVKDQPTPLELAQQLARSPEKFLEKTGFEDYLAMLRQLAAHYPTLKQNRTLVRDMKSSAFLIGVVNDGQATDETGEYGSSDKLRYKLTRAGDVYLIDDTVLGQIFNPLSAPMEAILEDMYLDLGAKWLSKQVTEATRPVGQSRKTAKTEALQSLIHERAPLLMYDGQQTRSSKDVVEGAEKVLKQLQVMEVSEIEITRTFNKETRIQKTTACLLLDRLWSTPYLFIAGEYDYFDVASSLGKVLFRQCRLNDSLLLSTLLSTSLVNLKRKGFPVDRILNLTASKLKQAVPAPPPKPVEQKAAQQASMSPAREASASTGPKPAPPPHSTNSSPPTNGPTDASMGTMLSQLSAIFPDADLEYLRQELAKHTRDQVETVSNHMMDHDYPKRPPKSSQSSTKSLSDQTIGSTLQEQDEVEDRDSKTRHEASASHSNSKPSGPSGFIDQTLSNIMNEEVYGRWRGLADQLWGGRGPVGPQSAKKPATASTGGYESEEAPPGTTGTVAQPPPGFQGQSQPGHQHAVAEINPTFTSNLKGHLERSIGSLQSQPESESEFRATIPNDPPAVASAQAANHCRILSDGELIRVSNIRNIAVYVDKAQQDQGLAMLAQSHGALDQFADLLLRLGQVFKMNPRSVTIYWDPQGNTVAFNRRRTLFFNFRFYLGLHYPLVRRGDSKAQRHPDEVYYYWFMVTCHELAHNFVSEHNSEHEFYFSSFAENYLKDLIGVLKQDGVV
ncbi:uncharacterized protein BJ171DRAFT_519741 [Polychytrium aggregatum]|uniref:uncharacterized protein n=1 Tax=Polychytrium aggregatum TaxID=110093 RepID=UPI0022FEEF89|nr:uncharacterized protein BJ171DRAFT_519741 [Polychytrium aggregatum]KAI9197496.1 hypothetical protein BJ171DRAFT_519741 [Polychytrium aggregatum]